MVDERQLVVYHTTIKVNNIPALDLITIQTLENEAFIEYVEIFVEQVQAFFKSGLHFRATNKVASLGSSLLNPGGGQFGGGQTKKEHRCHIPLSSCGMDVSHDQLCVKVRFEGHILPALEGPMHMFVKTLYCLIPNAFYNRGVKPIFRPFLVIQFIEVERSNTVGR